jgi:hypothetical protein
MTKKDKHIISNEIAATFELYGLEMSFSEFKDIFELGAEVGYQLALSKERVIHVVEDDSILLRKK